MEDAERRRTRCVGATCMELHGNWEAAGADAREGCGMALERSEFGGTWGTAGRSFAHIVQCEASESSKQETLVTTRACGESMKEAEGVRG
mmetsp:Transcript_20956/g.35984  ORF Transcript_20956/g.35984 Transcript_20956/m.35984 type:complete len:90 (-) Transcript_20956:348-617(-)